MIVFPKAKINLGLRITGKRNDGYHDIETVFYPVGLCDALEFVASDNPLKEDILTVTGIKAGIENDDNIVFKTTRLLRKKYTLPFLKIHLHKVIPVGAGLGGGSSDAAYLLKTINKCFGLQIHEEDLKAKALELGSDCPYFIEGQPSFATGRGEILEPIKHILSGYYLVLLNPGVGINTREAYQNCSPELQEKSLLKLIDQPLINWKELIINDFEDYSCKKYRIIGKMKEVLYRSGALFSSMSGSGSSVYGIFLHKPEIQGEIKEFVIWEGIL